MADGTKTKPWKKGRERSKSVSSFRLLKEDSSFPNDLEYPTDKREFIKKKSKKNLQEECVKLDSEIHVLNEKLQKFTAKNSEMEKENTSLKNQLYKIEGERDKIYRDVERLKNENTILKTNLNDEKAKSKENKSRLIAEIEKSRHENKNLRTSSDDEKAKLEKENREMKNEISILKANSNDEKAKSREEKSRLIAELEKSRQENKNLRTSSDDKKAKLEEEKREMKNENTILKADSNDEKAKYKEEKSRLIAELEKSRQENENLRTSSDAEKAKLEEEKREQMEMLANERTEHWKFTSHFIKLLEDSRAKVYVTGSCKNLQVGSSNIIKQDIMAQWKELTDKLCVSIDDHIVKRTELEMKVRNDEVLLKEINDTLQKVLKNIDKTTSHRLGQDKDLLEFLIYDRSDKRIFTDGIRELKNHIAKSKGRKKLPLEAEAAVARLLNKFDSISLREFVEVLEGKTERPESLITSDDADQTKKKEVFIEKMESIQVEESSRDAPLNRSSCVNVLVQWLELSKENDAEQLLGRIQVYESKLSTEMVSQFQEEIKHKHISNDPDEKQLCAEGRGLQENFETPFKSPSSTQSMQGLPDALSQFMHQLEGLKIVIDLDRKVDQISDVLKTLVAAINSLDVNKKENNDLPGNTHDSKRQCSEV